MSLPGFPPPLVIDDSAVVTAVVDDLLSRDGEALVLRGSELTLLSPVAALCIVRTADSPMTVAALEALLLDEFGMPAGGEPAVAVRQILRTLVDRGLIEVSETPTV